MRGPTVFAVTYDEDLADRIRELLGDESGASERRTFGGLGFLINGNMVYVPSVSGMSRDLSGMSRDTKNGRAGGI